MPISSEAQPSPRQQIQQKAVENGNQDRDGTHILPEDCKSNFKSPLDGKKELLHFVKEGGIMKAKWKKTKKINGMPTLTVARMIHAEGTPQHLKDYWIKELHKKGLRLRDIGQKRMSHKRYLELKKTV